MFLDRNFSIAAFLCLRRELAFIIGDIGASCRNQFHEFGVTRGHRLALRFQTFVALPRGCDRQSQIVQCLERFFLLRARAFFILFGSGLLGLVFSKLVARGIQFVFEFCHAFAGCFNLLLERRLFRFEIVDLTLGLFFFGLQQRNFVCRGRLREMRCLILRTSFVQLARGSFNIRLRLIALLDEDLALVRAFGFFFCQRCHARFAFKQRVRFHRAAPAENNSLRRNEFAIECGHSQSRLIFLARERVL